MFIIRETNKISELRYKRHKCLSLAEDRCLSFYKHFVPTARITVALNKSHR
jgi:hypothetical protein